MIRFLLLSVLILYGGLSHAEDLMADLETLNLETLQAEKSASNCLIVAQNEQIVIDDCQQASLLLEDINQKFSSFTNLLFSDMTLSKAESSLVMHLINDYNLRLKKATADIKMAKKITGIYNWTNPIAPNYYKY
jgi:hypothetical protein